MAGISSAVGGLERAQASLEQVAGRLAKASSAAPEDTVDLSAEMVKLLHARNAFQSKARVIEAEDQMQRAAVNLLG
ncbi:MAG TPA: flagellar basal body rod C-terminal domain-containing protein [Candidatus Solibacter sp.]|jgi:flagellar hook protein FlgE